LLNFGSATLNNRPIITIRQTLSHINEKEKKLKNAILNISAVQDAA
jgi:hypothetical protein